MVDNEDPANLVTGDACAGEPPAAVSSLEQIIQSMQQIKAAASVPHPTLPPKGAKLATISGPRTTPSATSSATPNTDAQQHAVTSEREQPSGQLPAALSHRDSMHASHDTALQAADGVPTAEHSLDVRTVSSSQQQPASQPVTGAAAGHEEAEESRIPTATDSMAQPEASSVQQHASTAEPDQDTLLASTAGPDQATLTASTSQAGTTGPQSLPDGKASKDSRGQKDSRDAKEKRSRGKEKESSKSKHGKKDKRVSRSGRQHSSSRSRSRSPKRYGTAAFLAVCKPVMWCFTCACI